MLEQNDLDNLLYGFKKVKDSTYVDSPTIFHSVLGLVTAKMTQGQKLYIINLDSTAYTESMYQGVLFMNNNTSHTFILGSRNLVLEPHFISKLNRTYTEGEKIYLSKNSADKHLMMADRRRLKALEETKLKLEEKIQNDEAKDNQSDSEESI